MCSIKSRELDPSLIVGQGVENAVPVPEIRRPFDVFAEGPLFENRDDRRWTFPNDLTGIGLLHSAIAQVYEFTADEFYSRAACCE